MNIEEELKKCNKSSVCVKFFANKEGNYILCPYGRSPTRSWIGLAKLDYFIEGNYKKDSKEVILPKIYECINVSMNFDKLNINRCVSSTDKLSLFIKKAKKEKYDGFSAISIDLDPDKDGIEIVEWEKVGKSGNEWRGNPDTFISLKYDSVDSKLVESIFAFIKF